MTRKLDTEMEDEKSLGFDADGNYVYSDTGSIVGWGMPDFITNAIPDLKKVAGAIGPVVGTVFPVASPLIGGALKMLNASEAGDKEAQAKIAATQKAAGAGDAAAANVIDFLQIAQMIKDKMKTSDGASVMASLKSALSGATLPRRSGKPVSAETVRAFNRLRKHNAHIMGLSSKWLLSPQQNAARILQSNDATSQDIMIKTQAKILADAQKQADRDEAQQKHLEAMQAATERTAAAAAARQAAADAIDAARAAAAAPAGYTPQAAAPAGYTPQAAAPASYAPQASPQYAPQYAPAGGGYGGQYAGPQDYDLPDDDQQFMGHAGETEQLQNIPSTHENDYQ